MSLSLNKPVPIKQRKEIYQKAISILEENIKNPENEPFGLGNDSGLCLLLPCVAWDLKNYLDDGPNGEVWSHSITQIAFPDIKDYLSEIYELGGEGATIKNKKRIEILKNIISTI